MVSQKNKFRVFPVIRLWQIMTPPGVACMDPRDTVGRIYKEDHYTLLHTKYEKSGSCGFGEEDFSFYVLPIVSLCELSVAMETTLLIQSAPKRNTINPPTQ